jgi:DNA mismatch repair protein MutL
MAYPEVGFQLDVETSTAFSSSGSGDLREVASSVYGLETARALLELSPEPGAEEGLGPFVSGMISPPAVDRANRTYISLFVNRRWVQDRMLGYALEQAYQGFLRERRYPLAVVNVTLAQQELDVNVHPTKTEVRFRRGNLVFAAVQQTVRRTLTEQSPVPEIMRAQVTKSAHEAPPSLGATFWPTGPFTAAATPPTGHALPSEHQVSTEPGYVAPPLPKNALPALRVLGQVRETYIVAEGPDGMYLIDQHAAHERVIFEKVRAEATSRAPQVQSLLEPATVELNPMQRELVESQQELISRLGFLVEAFGSDTYLLRGVPGLLATSDTGRAFLNVLDMMSEGGGFESWEERAAYSIACHSAIRAGKTLSHQEMSELARQLEGCYEPNTCPHGRPTMIHLSSSHLEREFGRR